MAKYHGHHILHIATPLKQLVCDLLGIDTLARLEELKEVETTYRVDMKTIHCLLDADFPEQVAVMDTEFKREYASVREALQWVGTNWIRKYNSDWHVEKLKRLVVSMGPEAKITVGDVRFENELETIKELGGTSFFIVRPDLTIPIMHHASEEALGIRHFPGHVIVNDGNLETFAKSFMERIVPSTHWCDDCAMDVDIFRRDSDRQRYPLHALKDCLKCPMVVERVKRFMTKPEISDIETAQERSDLVVKMFNQGHESKLEHLGPSKFTVKKREKPTTFVHF